MLRKFILAGLAAAALGSTGAAASEAAVQAPAGLRPAPSGLRLDPTSSQRQRRTILHFGEDDIRGDITRPDGELVQAPRKLEDVSLLRVRRSFLDRALAAPLRGR